MKRGLIIPSSMLVTSKGEMTTIGGTIPPELLRKWLLLWDEFICPDNNFISTGLSDDMTYLQEVGLLARNRVPFSGSITSRDFAKLFLAAQEITFHQKNTEEPGKWAMASSAGILSDAAMPGFRSCLLFELANVVQIPGREVSLPDIIEFKTHRRDEFEAFHTHLGEVYLRIISSRDIPRTRTLELEKLEQSLADINKIVSESFSSRCLTGIRTVIDRSAIEAAGLGLASASLAPAIGLPALNLGVFAAMATFTFRNALTTGQDEKARPLTYVASAMTRL